MIRDFAKLIPKSVMDRSGSVFYSGRAAFDSQSRLYLLGVNPGGDPVEQSKETVTWHTNRVLNKEPGNWSAYRDESWRGRPPGTYGMAPRVLHLFRTLGLNPGEVPASNIVFVRSGREDRLDGDMMQLAMECWPFHQAVIDRLAISVIVCMGQSAGNWIRGQLNAKTQIDEFTEKNRRRWKSRAYTNAEGMTVVVMTHPSIVNWASPATDPTGLVREALG